MFCLFLSFSLIFFAAFIANSALVFLFYCSSNVWWCASLILIPGAILPPLLGAMMPLRSLRIYVAFIS